jgi:two-component system OmpR family response regulator
VEVALVPWPEESDRLEALRAAGVPRLLLVAARAEPVANVDDLEDWVRLPADDRDVQVRVQTLRARADGRAAGNPIVDADGLVRFRGRWVALSPVEAALAVMLVERLGSVVGREVLARRAWPDGMPTRNALDVHVLRLRRRLHELDLEIRTVRSRGYILQALG